MVAEGAAMVAAGAGIAGAIMVAEGAAMETAGADIAGAVMVAEGAATETAGADIDGAVTVAAGTDGVVMVSPPKVEHPARAIELRVMAVSVIRMFIGRPLPFWNVVSFRYT